MKLVGRLALTTSLVLVAGGAFAEGSRAPIEISVLSYNTHGLPSWVARDEPRQRFPLLLERARSFEIVLLQEDFGHHDLVKRQAHHPVVLRGNGPRAGWLGFAGSGLTLLAHTAEPLAQVAEAYGTCHGWLFAETDCLANKGFLMARLRLANGAEVDFYDTHLEAGRDDADHDVRALQFDLLEREVAERSAGRAVVLGGDLNTDWDTPRDRALVEGLAAGLGLSVGAMTPAGTWPRRLDYLLYRSGSEVSLERLDGGEDRDFVREDGRPLSDHPAIFLRLEVR